MPRWRTPRCAAPSPYGTDRPCGGEMRVVAERDPSFGPNWRPGHGVFCCKVCGAVRAVSLAAGDRYAERYR